MTAARWIALPLLGLFCLTGCGGGSDSPSAPPSGWTGIQDRMWKTGVDTAAVFRDLSSLPGMGIVEQEFALSAGGITQGQFQKAVKRSLEELYRSNPALVDSLFEQHAVPVLQDVSLGGAVQDGRLKDPLLRQYRKKAFKAVDEHYQPPSLKEGIRGLPLPDSLHTQENSGRVTAQVHVDSTGTIDAIEVVEGTHPTLNAIVMRAVTSTTWTPAYVTEGQTQVPYSGWARLPVDIPAPR
ncbi:MAG: hypothetical protein BRD55_03900 [Bacteroidetes bacterium SW_9_63_38]|nr:MAG: hypothetical protein BRD55_03900 [Bacteroidetes bacterium SW_9_63_38]